MAGSPRNTIKTLYRKLQEQYQAETVCLPKERVLLEHLVYAIFLENSPAPAALKAFQTLEDYFIDWNEIRVSTTAELADILSMLPFAERASERLRRTLQWIFDNTYKFDLEEWRHKDVESFGAFLAGNPFSTRFMNEFVLHFVMGAGRIPFDEGALRVMRLLDLVELDEENKETVRVMERAIASLDADEFFVLLHQLGCELMTDPTPKKVTKLLKSVDPESETRAFVSMVETDADRDPAQIARQMAAAQQPHRPKPSMMKEMDDVDMLDDPMESEFSVQTDDDDEDQNRFGRRDDKEDDIFNSGRNRDADLWDDSPKEKKSKDKKEKSSAGKKKSAEKSADKTADKPEKPLKEKKSKEKKPKETDSEKPAKKGDSSKKGDSVKGDSPVKSKSKAESEEKSAGKKPAVKGGKGKKVPEQADSRPPDKKRSSGDQVKSAKKTGDSSKKSSPKKTR